MDDLPRDPASVAERDGLDAAVRLLIGKPLQFVGRATTLLWLHFGEVRTVISGLDGTAREVGEYAIHTESPWHLLGLDGMVVTGKGDLAFNRNEPPDYDDDAWGEVGGSRCDRQLEGFRPLMVGGAMRVEAVAVDRAGALFIELTGGYRLAIFPNDSTGRETWRMFEPGSDAPHLVMTSRGLQACHDDDDDDGIG